MTPQDNGRLTPKHASKFRFQALNAFHRHQAVDAGLTPADAWVWTVMFTFTDAETSTVSVSIGKIVSCTGLSTSTVWRSLATLKKKGFIKVIKRGGISRGPSTYKIRSRPTQVKTKPIKNP